MNRGADIVARTLVRASVKRVFTLSGNHVMSIFDAAPAAGLDLVHVRHEAAAVHMADAWARFTGDVGVALATGGPGHANAVPALYTALASESPVVLLSGHSPLDEMGRGAFQEMRQVDLAAPLTKASWAVSSASELARDVARAMRIAASGRPGPVHLSLPSDALDATVADAALPVASAFAPSPTALAPAAAEAVLGELARAARPVILVAPTLLRGPGRDAASRLAATARIPLAGMDSPRGLAEPALGALAEMLPQADLVVLLGKPLDFMLKFGRPPVIAPDCRFVQVDPDPAMLERTSREIGARLAFGAIADAAAAAATLVELAAKRTWPKSVWFDEVTAAIAYRPSAWATVSSARDGQVHPLDVCRAVQRVLDRHEDAVLISDGGEFGQWAQACLTARRRTTNGPAGAIGAAVPFAVAAKLAFPDAPVVAMSGDGSFGFHMGEYDTAARRSAPFIAVVGNDARWNAEHQIQIKSYGSERAIGCELLPTRYDLVAAGLGGHGEHVVRATDLAGALDRAVASQRPACVNVAIESLAAPDLSRRR
jgi:acetolactate synthase I/II/III large subunit